MCSCDTIAICDDNLSRKFIVGDGSIERIGISRSASSHVQKPYFGRHITAIPLL